MNDAGAGEARQVARGQRERIVDAMARVVSSTGYADSTVGGILDVAGVSRSTFYQHYRSKEECFDRTFADLAARVRSLLEGALEGTEPWPERMARALRTMVGAIGREPELAGLFLNEARSATPRSRDLYERTMADFEEALRRSAPPSAADCPPEIARATVGGVAGVLHREVAAGRVEGVHDLVPCLVYWAIAPYEGRRVALEAAGYRLQVTAGSAALP